MDIEAFQFLLMPFLACLILLGIHAYLGIHVLLRGVIFVDIALAQIAALGTTVAFLLGHELDSRTAYFYSLGFTFAGAAVFALSRRINSRVPQEAIIGITYAVASATAILFVDRAPHGAEHIKYILVGNILWVTPAQVLHTALIYGVVGIFHYLCRKPLLALSMNAHQHADTSRKAIIWDLLFYMSFGFVITSSVQIAGVLLVFSFLIVPAVVSALFVDRVAGRLALGWSVGFVVSIVGILGSYKLDLPTGATVVATFGVAVILAGCLRFVLNLRSKEKTL